MVLLSYEAARHAIDDLVEYEPDHTEYTITVLLTEVIAYEFLINDLRDDFRYGRLSLRHKEYESVVQNLNKRLADNSTEPDYANARELWPALTERLLLLGIDSSIPSAR
jgi:hypothetical protein